MSLMLELEEARGRLLAAIKPLSAESVSINSASARILAKDMISSIDLPSFDNSAMDGYAVRAEDVVNATSDTPVSLGLAGHVAAGEAFIGKVRAGTCIRVFTGSMLPTGADVVVMQEDTRIDESAVERILILDSAKPWENVRFRGEDVKRDSVLMRAGERLTPGRIGLLAATGVSSVEVARQPVIGLLATGSELVEPGGQLVPGKIFESNRAALEPLLQRSGALVRTYPLVPDTLAGTKEAMSRAFEECDGVVTSGGVSVGELDFVKAAFEELSGSLEFWKVAIKPGKPFVFGRWGEKLLFGLPGNPVSALVTFLLLVRPALLRWQGATDIQPRVSRCLLGEPLINHGDRRHFIRVRIDEAGIAKESGRQASHRLASLAEANALVDVPPKTTLPANSMVSAIHIDE